MKLTPDLEKKIESLFNDAVEKDENLTESGTMNWNWVFADVWMDLTQHTEPAMVKPELENFNFSATHPGVLQLEINDFLELMADGWADKQLDYAFGSSYFEDDDHGHYP